MKRFIIGVLLIIFISFSVSLFVKAEDTSSEVVSKVESGRITTNIRIDHSVTKLNFFKKNINVIVDYKKTI